MRTERVIELIRASDPLAAASTSAVAVDEELLHRVIASPLPQRRPARRLLVRVSVVAAACAVAVPAVAFADQIGSLIGLYDQGTPIPSEELPSWQVPALARLAAFSGSDLRQVGQRDGVSFYAAKTSSGGYCLAIGLEATPSIDALKCGADTDGFPSAATPVSDFSFLDYSGGTTSVTRLSGFAADQVMQIAVLGADGSTLYATPVVNGLYAADVPPQKPAAAIVGLDSSGKIIYRRDLIAPAAPTPAVP